MTWTPEAGAGRDARARRRRHPAEDRERLRRLTVAVAVAATGLNAALFLQTAAGSIGSGDPAGAIASLIAAVFPGRGLSAPAATPTAQPFASPVAVSGGS